MNYIKTINGERHCKPASKIVIIKDGMQIFNATEEMLLEDGWVLETNEVQEISEEEIAYNERVDEIADLKEQLSSSDYKVIKCMEASFCGEEMPYDIKVLHAEREGLRNRINELENMI